jgi:hypothetical protein
MAWSTWCKYGKLIERSGNVLVSAAEHVKKLHKLPRDVCIKCWKAQLASDLFDKGMKGEDTTEAWQKTEWYEEEMAKIRERERVDSVVGEEEAMQEVRERLGVEVQANVELEIRVEVVRDGDGLLETLVPGLDNLRI